MYVKNINIFNFFNYFNKNCLYMLIITSNSITIINHYYINECIK